MVGLYWIWLWVFILSFAALSDWFLVNRRDFGPQGVKQVVIFRFALVWIKGRLALIIIMGKEFTKPPLIKKKKLLNPHWLPFFSCFKLLGGSPKWWLQWANESQLCFKGKNGLGHKLWAMDSKSIRFFEVEISGTRSHLWAWDATSVSCPLGSTHEMNSCKSSERNLPIPSKPHSLNFPNM